jgi:hypothetical protein
MPGIAQWTGLGTSATIIMTIIITTIIITTIIIMITIIITMITNFQYEEYVCISTTSRFANSYCPGFPAYECYGLTYTAID